MKILEVKSLELEDVKVIRYGYFPDDRGFFTEPFRKSDLLGAAGVGSVAGQEIVQVNESLSRKGVMRGLHFQWNPFMGKLVRTISGHMIDMFLDIRKDSPTFGKISLYDMPCMDAENYCDWIWVPPGMAHGNFFLDESNRIEYLCTGEYSPGCEAAISPLAEDLDWSLCPAELKARFDKLVSGKDLILSEKDQAGLTLAAWAGDERSANFVYGRC